MLRDVVIDYYLPKEGTRCNCAEAMINAANTYYNLNLSEDTLSAACCYGGGSGHDELCGGVSGALIVLGILYANGARAADSPMVNVVRQEFFDRFDEVYPSARCGFLRPTFSVPERRCESILNVCADILEEVISKHEVVRKDA